MIENKDADGIYGLYQATLQAELEAYSNRPKIKKSEVEEATIEFKKKLAIARSFIEGLELEESVYKYPMHTLLASLPATDAPFYGLTQKEALETEVTIGKSMANTFPGIAKLLEKIYGGLETGRNKVLFTDQDLNKIYEPFTSARGEEIFADIDSIALNKLAEERDYDKGRGTERPLERSRRVAIAIIHGLDEIAQSGEKGDIRTWNEHARKKAFPRLFSKLIEKEFITVIGDRRSITLKADKDKEIVLMVGTDGRLLITTPGSEKANYAKNINRLPNARKWLVEEGGVWDSQSNRLKLSNFIKFPDNLSLDERREVLSGWLREEFYDATNKEYNIFDIQDLAVFWLSFIGQVTNAGLRDRRAINLQVNRAEMDPRLPYTYQYNDMLLTLLAEFEPLMKDSYLWHFNNIVDSLSRVSLREVIGALQGDIRMGAEILFEKATSEGPKAVLTSTFYENLKDFDGGFFKSNDYSSFKKILKKEGYAGGLKELRKLFSKMSTLRTLASLQINIGEILNDIAHLSPETFKNKYDKLNHPEIARTFSRYEAAADSTIERAISLDKSENLLAQLYYLYWKAEQRELKRSKLPNKWWAGKMIDEMYAPMLEKKTYAFADEDEVIGYMMTVDSTIPRPITPKKVGVRYKVLPNTNPFISGEASLAIMKGERADRTLNLHKEEMSLHLEKVEDFIKILQSQKARSEYGGEERQDNRMKSLLNNLEDSKAPELLIRRLIFEMAEDMKTKLGVTVIEGSIPGTFYYRMKGSELTYDDIFDLIQEHFGTKSAEWKTYFLAALEYRKLYDHRVRNVVISALRYLDQIFETISSDITSYNEGMVYVARAIKVYSKYLEQLDERFGDYMPHRYPLHVYEEMWKSENSPVIKEGLFAQREAHRKMRDNGVQGWDPAITGRTDKELTELTEERLDNQWVRLEESGIHTSFIPNFQKRKIDDPKVGYAKTSARVHTDYIFKLIEGAKRDVLLADWFLFHKLATGKGENLGVINSMRHWFGSQLTNKILHSKKIKIDKLKKGMNVSFLVKGEWIQTDEDEPIKTELRVSGIVRKVTADRIFLFVDPSKAITEAQRRLKAYENIHGSIANVPGGIPATAPQIKYIHEMINDGYLDTISDADLSELTLSEANEIIYKALNAAVKNPDKLGSYKRDQLYSRRLDATKDINSVDRFIRYGAVEYLETKAREIRNIKLIQGYWDNPIMDKSSYALLRGAGATFGFIPLAYQRTMGMLILGLLMAPKALFRNGAGLLVAGLSHMPIKGAKMFTKGISKYMGLREKSVDKMSERERTIYNTLASLSLARTTSVIKLTLGSLNINREDILVHKKWYQKIGAAYKLFNEATGYGKFIKELRKLNKEYRKTKSIATKQKIRKLKQTWNKKVTKIFEEDVKYNEKDIEDIIEKLKTLDPEKITLNEAIELGITKKKALLAFGKLLYDTVYEGPLGIATQALAEYGRIPTFYMYYELAKQNGHAVDVDDGIQYAINAVQGFNALYAPQNKQRDANSRLGRAYLQFVQYQLNSIMTNIKLTQDAVLQSIGRVGPGKLNGIRLALAKDFTTVTELSKKLEDQGYATKNDVNIVRAVLVRWISNAIAWQVGVSGTIMGLQYVVDPFIGAVLGGLELLSDLSGYLFGGDDDDDEEMLKRDIVEGVYETVVILGTPWKQGVQVALRPDEQDIVDALIQGRIASQFGTLERAVNTAKIAFGMEEEMSRKEVDKNLIDPVWAIDNFITGMGLVGPRRYVPEETDWTRLSMFLGEEDLTFPPHEGIFDEETPWLNAIQRLRTGFLQPHRSILPLGHKIFPNN